MKVMVVVGSIQLLRTWVDEDLGGESRPGVDEGDGRRGLIQLLECRGSRRSGSRGPDPG